MKYKLFNPCSNGILKYNLLGNKVASVLVGLNPCSNGILKYRTISVSVGIRIRS